MNRKAFWITAGFAVLGTGVLFLVALKQWILVGMGAAVAGVVGLPAIAVILPIALLAQERAEKYREHLRIVAGVAVGGVVFGALLLPVVFGSLFIVERRIDRAKEMVVEETAPALERYRERFGRYPENIAEGRAQGIEIPMPRTSLGISYQAWAGEEPGFTIYLEDPTRFLGEWLFHGAEAGWFQD